MAKTKISEFSATPANNTDIDSINLAEGCAPSGINDAIRELMAQLKDFQTGAAGDSFNGPVGTTTAAAGAFTNLTASGTLGVTGATTLSSALTYGGVTLSNAVTGTGNMVLSNSPTLVTPALGTPASGVVTNLTGTASININGTVGAATATTGAFTTLAASGAVTLSGGTANGVAYLNGSKVLTSGSALTFDGTFLDLKAGVNQRFYRSDNTRYGFIYADNNGLNIGATSVSGEELRLSATGSQIFYTGSTPTEQMRLTSTGLGIGTSSPAVRLQARSSGTSTSYAGNVVARLESNGAGYSSTLQFSNNVDASATLGLIGSSLGFGVGITQMLTLDSSGNLGLGVTPSAWQSTSRALQIGTVGSVFQNAAGSVLVGRNHYVNASVQNIYLADGYASRYFQSPEGSHNWSTAPSGTAGNAISFTQAMTLDASGNLLVGTTALSTSNLNGTAVRLYDGGSYLEVAHNNTATSGQDYAAFRYNGTQIGGITQAGTTGVLYNVTSDYRLKTVVGPVANAGQRIDALQPVEYEWKADGARTRGFLAHQFQEVYAGSVTGSKDAVDDEGKPVYQAMQSSSPEVIADLVAEIQSLRQRLAALESK